MTMPWRRRVEATEGLVSRNRARAVRLLDDAERIANSITDEEHAGRALNDLAAAAAATDPVRAERIANFITREPIGHGRSANRQGVAATDPGRAVGLADSAERVANSITDEHRAGMGVEGSGSGGGRHRPGSRRARRQLASPASSVRHRR